VVLGLAGGLGAVVAARTAAEDVAVVDD